MLYGYHKIRYAVSFDKTKWDVIVKCIHLKHFKVKIKFKKYQNFEIKIKIQIKRIKCIYSFYKNKKYQ